MFCLRCRFLPCCPLLPPSLASPCVSYQVHRHMQHDVHMCMHAHTHTPPACHLVVSLISSSLVVFAPSFSAFNSASYPSFSRSLHPRPWPHPTEPSIQPFSSWMQILECDKSFWFLSSHFAVATESKTLNTAPTLPRLFTEPSMHTHTATKMHTDKRMHTRIHICMYASVHRLIHRHTGKPGPI